MIFSMSAIMPRPLAWVFLMQQYLAAAESHEKAADTIDGISLPGLA